MAAVIAMLRGINLPHYQKLSMAALKTLCTGLPLRNVQTYIQSGNLVFEEDTGDLNAVAGRLEQAIQDKFGFRPSVLLRTAAEMRQVIAKNPFAGRPEVAPNRLLVVFLAASPTRQTREQLLALDCAPEELRTSGRELYIYYPDGMARPKIPLVRIEKMLQCASTGRNWNTVNKLMAMADAGPRTPS